MISIFDNKFADYAFKMYKSFYFFNKNTPMYAGVFDLSDFNKKRLEKINVNIIFNKDAYIPKHLCMLDLTVFDYLKNIDFDQVMWIDADTIILRPIEFLFELKFDYVGHGGGIDEGKFHFRNKDRSWIARKRIDNFLLEENQWGKNYAMGLWVANNVNLLMDFRKILMDNPLLGFEGDVCSKVINEFYSHYQLNGYEWTSGTRQNELIGTDSNGKIVLKTPFGNYEIYQYGYSRLDDGSRPKCFDIENFYYKYIAPLKVV